MRSLRVILVLLEPPLPFGAAVGRWFSVLLSELVRRGHRVTAFAACSKESERLEAAKLFPIPDYDLRLYNFPNRGGLRAKLETLRQPYSYMFSKELNADLQAELSRGYDVLHLEQPWTGWLGREHARKAILSVLNLYLIDASASPPRGLYARWQRHLMLSAERQLLRSYDRFFTLSERLRDAILSINPQADVNIVPLGIDATRYPFIVDSERTREPVISIIGNMAWYPSSSAAERLLVKLWPAIKASVPAARVRIVGWEARRMLAAYLGKPDVTIEENVPETRPYFEQTGVMLYAPGRGSGMKVKVLEAFGYGVPVVTTSEGVEGLPAIDGVHAGIADDDAGLIDRTVKLLQDAEAQNRQRRAARELLETHCGPKPTVDAIERTYRKMTES